MNNVDITINEVYEPILETDAQIVINYGGRDTGKSYFTGGQLIPLRMIQDDYFRGVCIRDTYTSLKDSCYTEVVDGINELQASSFFNCIKSPLEITCKNGNKLIFRGLDNYTNIKSLKGINFIWVEEAEKLTVKQFYDLLVLLRGQGKCMLIATYNPVNPEDFAKDTFIDPPADKVLKTFEDGDKKIWEKHIEIDVPGQEPVTLKALIVKSVYSDNEFISPIRKAVIENYKNVDPYTYKIYAKAEYAERGGRILINIQERDFEADELEFVNFDNKGYGQDFGFNHANAILAVAEKDNCLYVFDELYGYEKDTAEWIEEANKRGLHKGLPMICDCAEPDRIKTWVREGYRARGVKKFPGSPGVQIDRLKRYDKIYINSACKNTLKEAKAWKWKQDKNENYLDEPVTVFDDAMAALRYSTDLFSVSKGWQRA